jgi:hypothetical protein
MTHSAKVTWRKEHGLQRQVKTIMHQELGQDGRLDEMLDRPKILQWHKGLMSKIEATGRQAY